MATSSNVMKSKTEKSPLKRDPKRPVKHFIKDYFEKKSSGDYFKHIVIKTKREQAFIKKIDELEVKLKLLEKETSVLIQKVKNLESENSKLRTIIGKDENVNISKNIPFQPTIKQQTFYRKILRKRTMILRIERIQSHL